jgi:predicted aconitase
MEKKNNQYKNLSMPQYQSSKHTLHGQSHTPQIKEKKYGNSNKLKKREFDITLYSLRKILEDLNSMELVFVDISPRLSLTEYNRLKQYIDNNKKRAQRILWTITGQQLSESDIENMDYSSGK